MGPYYHAKFQKKLMSQFLENLRTDGRTDGRTDTPYFVGPFWPRPRVQKWFSYKKKRVQKEAQTTNYSYFQNLFTRILNKNAEVVVQRCSVKVFLEIL